MPGEGKSTAAHGGSKLGRIVKAPYRALRRVRDMYVSSLTGCAGRGGYRGVVGYTGASSGVPRSFSFHPSRSSSSREDDLRDLVRVASQGAMGSLSGFRHQSPEKKSRGGGEGSAAVPRSHSVAAARIDEDKPCEFGMDVTLGPLYPRSRSCAVVNRRLGVAA